MNSSGTNPLHLFNHALVSTAQSTKSLSAFFEDQEKDKKDVQDLPVSFGKQTLKGNTLFS